MAKKILLILRVSTDDQDTQSQLEDMIPFIKTKGFNEDEIEILKAVGASARKINKEYLEFIENIKRITSGENGIKTIAMWHLNRLGRNRDYLYEMESYFVKNKIQMYVKNGFELPLLTFDKDGNAKETFAAKIAFAVYATTIEEETEELIAKTRRGMQQKQREGKYIGGKLKTGFKVNENQEIIIDPEKSDIIREIFRLYTEENWSAKRIYDYFTNNGTFKPYVFKNRGYHLITSILRDKRYSEGKLAFIPKETQDKAIEMLSTFKERKRSNNIYFGKNILRDKKSNARLNASLGQMVYANNEEKNSYNLNINVIDYIIWKEARRAFIYKDANDIADNEENFKEQIASNQIQIRSFENKIDGLRKEIERAVEMNIKNPKYYPTEKLNKLLKENEKVIEQSEREISSLNMNTTRLKGMIEGIKNDTLLRIKNEDDEYYKQLSDEEKKKIIDSVFKIVEIEKTGDKHYIITFQQVIDIVRTSVWEYYNEGHNIKLIEYIGGMSNLKKDHSKLIKLPENKHINKVIDWKKYYKSKKLIKGE